MSMTREEATEYFESLLKRFEEMHETETSYWGKVHAKTTIEATRLALSALRPVSREQVEKVWRGEWKHYLPPLGAGDIQCRCTQCGITPDTETPFCPFCGAPMTDDAVQMVLERLEALHETVE